MTNVLFAQLYGPKLYTPDRSTQVSNSLTVGTIIGQITIGLLCDYKGRKWGIVLSTVCICVGVILATAAHGSGDNLERNFAGFIWFMTVARGLTGIGVGGEYPSSSLSSGEAANERMQSQRGPIFILVTVRLITSRNPFITLTLLYPTALQNLVLSFGGVFASSLYLIVFEAAGGVNAHLPTVWRTVFGISVLPRECLECVPPFGAKRKLTYMTTPSTALIVFIFRLRMLNSKLYRKGAIQRSVPYPLVIRYYWKSVSFPCFLPIAPKSEC